MNPVHQKKDGTWWWWDETWSSEDGPYDTEQQAQSAIKAYAEELDMYRGEIGMIDEDRGAEFSSCRRFRYMLWRIWNRPQGVVTFIGLNPSTADENEDDPTIRRCIGFARDWGYGGICMINLFAYRTTDPRELTVPADPVGPGNDECLVVNTTHSELLVAAWGASEKKIKIDRATHVLKLLHNYKLHHLGLSKNGHPRHPLYLPKSQMPEVWEALSTVEEG